MVESNLGIATGIANPFSNVKFAGRIAKQRINSDAPSLLITCGLALRGVM
jgi:type IV pilus assembly protein PilM